MQTRSLVHARPQRNLLLLIDGKKSEDQLLASVTGVTREDLLALHSLGLVSPGDGAEPMPFRGLERAPVDIHVEMPTSPGTLDALPSQAQSPVSSDVPSDARADSPSGVSLPPAPAAEARPGGSAPGFDHASRMLTAIISSELGLRGFMLTLEVERAASVDELMKVAEKVYAQLLKRKGPDAAEKARSQIMGH